MLDQATLGFIAKTVYRILPKEDYKAFVFGSWAQGENRKYSDIDLGIEGNKKIDTMKRVALEESFEGSSLPYRIDLVDFSTVDDTFKEEAKKTVILL